MAIEIDLGKKIEILTGLDKIQKEGVAELVKHLPQDYREYFTENFRVFMEKMISVELKKDSKGFPYEKITDLHLKAIDIIVDKYNVVEN
jgi:hypothetical protein